MYFLAAWNDGTYTYSFNISKGLSKDDMEKNPEWDNRLIFLLLSPLLSLLFADNSCIMPAVMNAAGIAIMAIPKRREHCYDTSDC